MMQHSASAQGQITGMPQATAATMNTAAQPQAQCMIPPAPQASQGTPGMPNMTAQAQVTMSTGIGGNPASFAQLNTVTQQQHAQLPMLHHSQIKHEQTNEVQAAFTDFTDPNSQCNSLNLDSLNNSGLLQFITDDQADSLTRFLDANMQPLDANMQQDPMMVSLDDPTDSFRDIHNQLSDLNH